MSQARMVRYVGRRLLRSMLLLAGISILTFCLFELAPGDYFDELRLSLKLSNQTIAALREQHGINQTIPARYVRWVRSVTRGEWGVSVAYNTPAGPLLWGRARNTLLLTLSAALAAWTLAIPIAIWAVAGAKWRRFPVMALTSILLVVPDLLIVLALTLVAAHSGFLPAGGISSPDFGELTAWGKMRDVASHLLIPGAALVLTALPILISHARTAIDEVLECPFILAARANGIPRLRLLVRHALPAAANPLITLFGFSIGTLLSSSLLVEVTVGWPGLGRLLLEAILQRDLYIVVGAVMLSGVFYVLGNFLADVLLYVADPRIREEG